MGEFRHISMNGEMGEWEHRGVCFASHGADSMGGARLSPTNVPPVPEGLMLVSHSPDGVTALVRQEYHLPDGVQSY
jgi:hypothetical protein